jgi:hypothetical protein
MNKRFVFLPLFVAAASFCGFLHSSASEHLGTLAMMTLIVMGMCLGVLLMDLLALSTRNRKTGGS